MSIFSACADYTIKNEGGFSNNPADPGGPTNWGITLETLSAHRGKPCSVDDIKNLSYEEAVEIYQVRYFDPAGLNALSNQTVAIALFDIGLNRGFHKAIEYAQEACGVPVDGTLGPKTSGVLNAISANKFLVQFLPPVQRGYAEILLNDPTKLTFLNGWLSRSLRLLTLLTG